MKEPSTRNPDHTWALFGDSRAPRILILENDDASYGWMLDELLQSRTTFEVRRAVDEPGFRQQIREFHPDLVIGEYALSVGDAFSILEMAHRNNPPIPAVLLCEGVSGVEEMDALSSNQVGIVVKSRMGDLPGMVRQLLNFETEVSAQPMASADVHMFQAAVEASANAILITNARGDIIWANPACSRLTGYSIEEMLGQNPRLFESRQNAPGTFDTVWRTILAGEIWEGEIINRRKDGSFFPERLTITPVRDAGNRISHFIGVMEDLTRTKEVEARQLQNQRVEIIGNLANGIAHDLNNILTPIVLCAPLLQMEESAENRQEIAKMLEASANRAVGVVKQLLGFARGTRGERISVQVRHLVDEIADMASETFPPTIEVETDCASELWEVVADPTQLHQVLMNLCINARDAMPTGGKLILRAENVTLDDQYVGALQGVAPGPFIRIQVSDTGIGIPAEVSDRVFEAFFTTKEPGHGTGIGLTTTKRIVQDHKGFISFRSSPGSGTTFEVHLPVAAEFHPAAAAASSEEPAAAGCGELVLVVDDEPANRDATRRILLRQSYRVLQAADGIEALSLFLKNRKQIRAVITDHLMPRMDGMVLSRTLRSLEPNLPIIVSSGGLVSMEGAGPFHDFEKLGIVHIFHKPHTSDCLLGALSSLLAASRVSVA